MDTPTILTLDLHDCPDIAEMHRRIQEAFAFPDYYGKNWNAFWDLIRGTRDNTLVEILGVSTLPAALRGELDQLVACLEDNRQEMQALQASCPQFDCRFAYRLYD